jgi:phosphoenolpyruvate carboxykinase (ATP)
MSEFGIKGRHADLAKSIGLTDLGTTYWNLNPSELVEETLINGQGVLSDTGALCVSTGEFTGRSPKDRFIVKDAVTENAVWWGDINIPFDADKFDNLYNRMKAYLAGREMYVRDAYVCADPNYRMSLRVVTEYPDRKSVV